MALPSTSRPAVPVHLKTTPALVLNSGPAGLSAVRSLGRSGIRVVNVDFNSGPASKSRYCEFSLCPAPAADPEGAIRVLIDQAQRLSSPPVLFAASDVFVSLVAARRERLAPYFHLALPPPEFSDAMLDKRKQHDLVTAAGIDCAKTIYPETEDDVVRMGEQLDYPAFIKPQQGHVWRQHFANKGFVVNSPAELRDRCREIISKHVTFLVQSFILGPPSNTYSVSMYIAADGTCLGSFSARKRRQFAVEAGVGTLVESYVDSYLIELGLRACRALRYRGIAEVEFKKDDRDGKLKFIELNPRLWVQSALAASAGVDFTLIQFLDLLGEPPRSVNRFCPGVVWLDTVGDYFACRWLKRRGELSLREWLKSWASARSFATFAPDDPLPFLKASKPLLETMVKSAAGLLIRRSR